MSLWGMEDVSLTLQSTKLNSIWTGFVRCFQDCMVNTILILLVYFDTCCKFIGEDACTMNVHMLRHLADSVRNWGPLWAS